MTAPRFIRPGKTWMLTRRTTRRHFLLRPDADGSIQNIYWYTTAVLARKFGIKLHAAQMLSTHIHEVVTDVYGQLPAFVRERNRAFANAVKCLRGWSEEVFQRAPASYVELCSVSAILEKIGYTLANCVEAGLTNLPSEWPGVTTRASDIGNLRMVARRPDIYFNAENPVWPARASIRIEMPVQLKEAFAARARNVVCSVVNRVVSEARETARRAGRLLTDVRTHVLISHETRATRPERSWARNPSFATSGDRTANELAVRERRSFYEAYAAARRKLRLLLPDGGRFPVGSWRWVVELLTPRHGSVAHGSATNASAALITRRNQRKFEAS